MKIDYMQVGAGLLVGAIAGYFVAKKYAAPATPAALNPPAPVPAPRPASGMFLGMPRFYKAPGT